MKRTSWSWASWGFLIIVALIPFVSTTVLGTEPLLQNAHRSSKWLFLCLGLPYFAVLFALGKFQLYFPRVKEFKIPAVLFMLGLLLCIYTQPRGFLETSLFSMGLFFAYSLIGFSIFYENRRILDDFLKFLFLSQTAVVLWLYVKGAHLNSPTLPFFGTPLATSTALGSFLVLQLYSLFQKNLRWNLWVAAQVLLALLTLGLLFRIGSRSALLGAMAVLVGLLWHRGAFTSSTAMGLTLRRIGMSVVFAFVVLLAIVSRHPEKLKTLELRWIKWQNTALIIFENPLGVGPGNFRSAYLVYNGRVAEDPENVEVLPVHNPHNSFLEIAAEMGILSLISVVLFLFVLLKPAWKKRKQDELAVLCLSLALFWFVDACLNFPHKFPYPLISMAFAASLALCQIPNAVVMRRDRGTIVAILIIVLIMCTYGLRFYYAEYLTSARPFLSQNFEKACRLSPENFMACIQSSELAVRRGDPEKAATIFDSLERRFPGHPHVIRAKIRLLWTFGLKEESCALARAYDGYYRGVSLVHETIKTLCPPLKAP